MANLEKGIEKDFRYLHKYCMMYTAMAEYITHSIFRFISILYTLLSGIIRFLYKNYVIFFGILFGYEIFIRFKKDIKGYYEGKKCTIH